MKALSSPNIENIVINLNIKMSTCMIINHKNFALDNKKKRKETKMKIVKIHL